MNFALVCALALLAFWAIVHFTDWDHEDHR